MKIYCRNYNCPENKKLENPVTVYPRKFYTPIGKEDNLYSGECQSKILNIVPTGLAGKNVQYSVALCVPTKEKNSTIFICSKEDCIYNNDKKCLKDEIMVDKLVVGDEICWICKSFSNWGISGHYDWSQNLNSNGTAKGGHIDDQMANSMYQDSLKFKSYGTHHKDAREPRRRGK